MVDLVICIYACHTIQKYKDQILKINETWFNYSNKVTILYFLGGKPSNEFIDHQYIYNKDLENDYISASYKQYYSMKYVYEKYKPKFVLCCGTDTFINVPKVLHYLSTLDSTAPLYIGGHGCVRKIGEESIYFHSGGPGFILTGGALEKVYPLLDTIMDKWKNVCKVNNVEYLLTACDVGMGYFASKLELSIIKTDGFHHCNFRGYPCCREKINMKDILCCHLMTLKDFDEFNIILKKNNFFIE